MRPTRLEPPASRRHHISLAIGDDALLLHGGQVYDQAPSQAISPDFYLLHTPSLRWAQPPVLCSVAGASATPTFNSLPRRAGHCGQIVSVGGAKQVVLFFGGLDELGRLSSDAWVLEF